MDKIRVLLVDDSMVFCETLKRILGTISDVGEIEVAYDAYDACEKIVSFRPDVMLLDFVMPRMSGENFLKKLMPQCYIPTIILTSKKIILSEVKSWGAFDIIQKPTSATKESFADFKESLVAKLSEAKRAGDVSRGPQGQPRYVNHIEIGYILKEKDSIINGNKKESNLIQNIKINSSSRKIIAMGASTGGTEALLRVLQDLPANTPPIVVVLHMPAVFTGMYAQRLNRVCKMSASEAVDGERLRRGHIILGAGEFHLRVKKDTDGYYVSSTRGEKISGHCPSVDALFDSVADVMRDNAIGVILTGMGADGAKGLLSMKNKGAFTIGESEESCVVYGMPKVAYTIGAVSVQAPLDEIPGILLSKL